MQSTRVQFTPDMLSRLAAPHNYTLDPVRNWDLPTFAGGGGIRSTADDLLTFLAANMGLTQTGLLPAMQLANTSQRPTDHFDSTVGLGWHLTQTDNGVIHWHNGQTGGYHSYMAWVPEWGIGVVVLANAEINNDDLGLHLLDPSNQLTPHHP
jgi:CubicO group peptidase (beta-lactamase class C family)